MNPRRMPSFWIDLVKLFLKPPPQRPADVEVTPRRIHPNAQIINDQTSTDCDTSLAVGAKKFHSETCPELIAIHLVGVVKTTQVTVLFLRSRGAGRIIYLSTALGRMGNELFPVYAASKWAVIGFAKSAALSYGRDGILCNTVAPGLARTLLADNDALLGRTNRSGRLIGFRQRSNPATRSRSVTSRRSISQGPFSSSPVKPPTGLRARFLTSAMARRPETSLERVTFAAATRRRSAGALPTAAVVAGLLSMTKGFVPGREQETGVEVQAPAGVPPAARLGGRPNLRRKSRLKWVGLSYPVA